MTRLSVPLLKKYIDRLPDSARDHYMERSVGELKNVDEDGRVRALADHYHDIIMTYRRDDLDRFLRMLQEDIPDDYVLSRAHDIIVDFELNAQTMDYDDCIISKLDEVLDSIDKMAVILKAHRQGVLPTRVVV